MGFWNRSASASKSVNLSWADIEWIPRYVDERVGEKKQLTGGVRIVDALPLAVTGKVARRKLKEDLMAGRI